MLALVPTSRWSHPDTRRREVLRASQDQDVTALCDLVTHHVRLKGQSGTDTSLRTLRNYHLAIRDFLSWCWSSTQTVGLNQLTAEHIEQYLAALRTRPRKPRTQAGRATTERLSADSARTYLYGVRALTRALMWAGVLDTDPTREVRAPRSRTAAHERKHALPTDVLNALLALPAQRHKGPERQARDEVMLVLGARLGLRLDEMVRLDVQDVNLQLRRVRVRHGKGRKQRSVDVPPKALEVLGRWLQLREALSLRGKVRDEALLISFAPGAWGRRLTNRGLYDVVTGYGRELGLDETVRGCTPCGVRQERGSTGRRGTCTWWRTCWGTRA